jgi:hypothetical protein
MVNHRQVKLGKKDAKFDPRTLRFGKYLLAGMTPKPAIDYTLGVSNWGMMLNDQLGCCTISGLGHAQQVVTQVAGKYMWTPPDAAILDKYQKWCGYIVGQPDTDQGGVELDVLNSFRKSKFWNHHLHAFCDVAPLHINHVKLAIELFGGVYIGVQLPISAQGQQIWDLSGDSTINQPGSWGGHAVFLPKYVTDSKGQTTFTAISWGENYEITEKFWKYVDPEMGPYIDEVHVLLLNDWTRWKGAPSGFDLETLETDFRVVTN